MPAALIPVVGAGLGVSAAKSGIDALSGKDARDAANRAAGQQEGLGREALEFSAEQTAPFREAGIGALDGLGQQPGVRPTSAQGLSDLRSAGQGLPGQFGAERFDFAGQGLNLPGSENFQFDTDPNRVLQNPIFQQAAKQQEQRLINQNAALGLGASGQTRRDLFANNAQLANQFLNEDVGRQQQEFANQFDLSGRGFSQGFASNAQNFQNALSARQQSGLEQQQRFGNVFDINQLGFNQNLAANQNRFGQQFEVARLGANAASQQATTGANILQSIGNARSAGTIGAANAQQQGVGNLFSLAGLFGGFSDIRLKDNIEYYDTTLDGVHIYSWDWNEEGKRLAGDQIEFGPIAQELRETHPENVVMGKDGYLMLIADEVAH